MSSDDTPVASQDGVETRTLAQRLRLPLMIAGPVVVLIGAAYMYFFGARYESTDDARVRAAQLSISSNIAGRVVELDVNDNQLVHTGDVLFKLDDSAYRIMVAAAQADLGNARLHVQELKAAYRQRESDLAAARDTLSYQRRERERQQRLLDKGIASRAQYDAAVHANDAAEQNLSGAQQSVAAALAALNGNADIPLDQHPSVMAAQAQLDHAQLNLSYATVTAPQEGVVAKVEELQVGKYINASQPVFTLVSTHNVWIEANFKEVQLAHMRPGQSATLSIDAVAGKFAAKVSSLSPGTGSEFSVLPAENATGNWVKVVQRVPVRLQFDDPQIASRLQLGQLQSGLSANVTVDTNYHRRLFGSSGDARDVQPTGDARASR